MEFHGVKIALLVNEKLLMHLRDNKPGLFNANMWDFPGGGREGDESAEECAQREVKEEFGIDLPVSAIVWQKLFPAQKDPNQKAVFMVAEMTDLTAAEIALGEGQKWQLFDQETFFAQDDVILALKERFQAYLDDTK